MQTLRTSRCSCRSVAEPATCRLSNYKKLIRRVGGSLLAASPRRITDRRSMAGTAPTDLQFTKMHDAGPVHCSVELSRTAGPPQNMHLKTALGTPNETASLIGLPWRGSDNRRGGKCI